MKRLIPVLLGCLILAGCDNHSPGRYQVIVGGGILRFDTCTGKLDRMEEWKPMGKNPTNEELAEAATRLLSYKYYRWIPMAD